VFYNNLRWLGVWCWIGCQSDTGLNEPAPEQSVLDPAIVAYWPNQKGDFQSNMQALSETERLQVVRNILHDATSPNTPDLCRSLISKQNQTYCKTLLNRAHLWEVPVIETPSRQKQMIEACPNHDAWCLTQVAIQQSEQGTVANLKPLCNSIDNTRSREECFFQVAETVVGLDDINHFNLAFTLCAEATHFTQHCQAHLIETLATSSHTNAEIIAILQTRSARSPIYPADAVNYFYSQRARHFPNDQSLPLNHLHSVQTYQFLREQTKTNRTLTEWTELFTQHKATIKRFAPVHVDGHIQNYWVGNNLPSTYYLSIEKRPTSADPVEDLQMALLAGLVQMRFPLDAIRSEHQKGPLAQMLAKVNPPQQTNKQR